MENVAHAHAVCTRPSFPLPLPIRRPGDEANPETDASLLLCALHTLLANTILCLDNNCYGAWYAVLVHDMQDRFADIRARPPIDESQDWFLLAGREENGFTILEFSRNLTTCDPRDLDIDVSGLALHFYHTHTIIIRQV